VTVANISDDRGVEQRLAAAFADTVNDGREWLAAEIAFLRAQVNDGFASMQSSLVSALIATACGTAGALVLALAVVDFAAIHMNRVWAGAIVGALFVAIALVLLLRARTLARRVSLIPDRIEKHILPKTRPADD
jgi:hypothetical protein